MKAEDVEYLKSQNKKGKKKSSKTRNCTVCGKQLTGRGTKNRWLRLSIDIRKLGFTGSKTAAIIYTGGYCSNEHLLVDMMKQIENLSPVEP